MDTKYFVTPVAVVRSTRVEPTDDHWGQERAEIILDESYSIDSLQGIEEFSHIEVVFVFD